MFDRTALTVLEKLKRLIPNTSSMSMENTIKERRRFFTTGALLFCDAFTASPLSILQEHDGTTQVRRTALPLLYGSTE